MTCSDFSTTRYAKSFRFALCGFVPVLAALALIGPLSATSLGDDDSKKKKKPNILFIFSDDHAFQAVSAYDSSRIKTPNIDRIAKGGMRFDRCYVTNSICGPMRAVIQTGLYSHKNGFVENGNRFRGKKLWTFPKAVQKAGYQTAVIGKWHLGKHQTPQGYNYSEVLQGQGPYYNPVMLLDKNSSGNRESVKHTGYTTEIITNQTLKWLKDKRDPNKPFLLMCQHKAPHREWSPAPKFLNKHANPKFKVPETFSEDYSKQIYPRRTQEMTVADHMTAGHDLKIDWTPRNLTMKQRQQYLAAFKEENDKLKATRMTKQAKDLWNYQRYMRCYLSSIESVDESVGQVLDYLDKSGLAENTIVIYCSDQGFYLGEHGWYDKRWVYEESLRTPFLVKWPGVIKEGAVNKKDIVSPLDFAATFCDITGAEKPSKTDGSSLVPVFKGQTPKNWRKDMYYHYYEYPGAHMVRRHYAVVDGQYKLIHFYEKDLDLWELIDLKADPLEQKNFYGKPEYKEIQAKLKKRLEELRKELNVPEKDPIQRPARKKDMMKRKKA